MTGYMVMGIGFGILLSAKGYNALWAFIMSVSIYSGTAQYLFINFISDKASLSAVALTSVITGARYLFYGVSMIDLYKNFKNKFKRLYMILALTDETYALMSVSTYLNGKEREEYCTYIAWLDHVYWIVGTVLGGILGAFIPFNTKGVDFSLTALFITICVDQWLDKANKFTNHLSALTGFASSLICLMIFGRKNFLIPSMAAIIIILFLLKDFINKNNIKESEI
ncbi:MAG: AzlC family ABC transporter permease [Synergistaceae bacterium]|nr:AzlC family ABC transporter permease [Synergistaceae bacterium]